MVIRCRRSFAQDGKLTFIEKDGIDYAPTTVQLPGGERVPFLFTVKNLVAQFAMMRSQMLKVSSLMKEAEDKGIDAGKSAEEMMASMWSDVGEGRVKRRRGKKKNTTKKTLSFDAPKRGFGQR